jgi:hypothetical protein
MSALPSLALRASVVAAALLTLAGCAEAPLTKGTSPLRPAQMSPDSVVLEMFFVRFPFGDKDINEKLWEQIDEQRFSPDLRQRLARNGFRVGMLGGQMPGELSKLMELSDKPAAADRAEGEKIENLQAEPRVVRRRLQLRAGQRSEITASTIYPQLPVLVCESGRVSGQTYDQAQGIFAMKSLPQADGRVRLELVPELHHDQSRQRYIGSQGMFRLDTSRPKKVYDDMAITAELAPGSMLILSSLANRPGSLGHHFFTESEPRLEQKLLIVRLAQTQHDGLFSPPDPLKLDEQTER